MKKDKKGFFEKLNYFILFCYYYDGLLEVRNFVQIHIKLVNKFGDVVTAVFSKYCCSRAGT